MASQEPSCAESNSDAVLVLPKSLLGDVDGEVFVWVIEGSWLWTQLSSAVRLVVLPVVVHLLQLVVDHSCKDAKKGAQYHVLPVTHKVNVGTRLIGFVHSLAALKAWVRLWVWCCC